MLIDWLRFSAALALLLTPIGLFHGRKVRFRPISHDWGRYWRQILALGLHTIDFGRALLGAWLLVDALAVPPGAKGIVKHGVLLTHIGVLWTAVLVQAMVCREPRSLHAPFAFVAGMVAGYFTLQIGVFAILFAAILAIGTRIPVAFFPVLALALCATTTLFAGRSRLLIAGAVAVAVMLPWLATLLFSRRLVISFRARRATTESTHAVAAGAVKR